MDSVQITSPGIDVDVAISTKIPHPGSKTKDKGDSRNPGDPCVYMVS